MILEPSIILSLTGGLSLLALSIGLAVRMSRQKIVLPPPNPEHHHHPPDMRTEMMRRLGQELNRSYVPRQRNIPLDEK